MRCSVAVTVRFVPNFELIPVSLTPLGRDIVSTR
jgi:uncharacterized membrane protein YccF (DUF307 family)